ncbi:high mobility group nucleosome-binding domain-containing protein 3 isoform X3 [Pungitius pungitius]|uniref:high mobility group nucleosome-binding domain-containing protein 3 isoform X3 n=1 Tax=Pungitius pungitius TaxID=134920 RepID=UPI002E154080
MPKRKSPEGPEGKEASKVTKQEKPAPPKAETKPKKAIAKKVVDDKGAKAKKSVAKGKKDDGHTQNGQTKTKEIYVSRPSVSVSSIRSSAPSLMSVRGQSETVRVKGTLECLYSVSTVRVWPLTPFHTDSVPWSAVAERESERERERVSERERE